MMRALTTSVLILTLFAASISTAHAVRTARTTVLSVFANSAGGAFIRLEDTADSNGAVCSNIGRYAISANSAGKNALLAAALTAKASGAEVELDLVGACMTDGEIQNVIVY